MLPIASTFPVLLANAFALGFFSGSLMILFSILLVEYVGIETMPVALGTVRETISLTFTHQLVRLMVILFTVHILLWRRYVVQAGRDWLFPRHARIVRWTVSVFGHRMHLGRHTVAGRAVRAALARSQRSS